MANWVKGAIKHPGALKRKAKKAGMSTSKFAAAHDKGDSATARQSRLAETLAKFARKGAFKKKR